MRGSRAFAWLNALAGEGAAVQGLAASVQALDSELGGRPIRLIAIGPDSEGRFARARGGEVGIDECGSLVRALQNLRPASAVIAIVDVPGQAFGWNEEALGLEHALADAVDAYVRTRRSGHPVAALLVGAAISGAFLAHGLQAGWIGALRDPGVEVHVMSEAAVARVSRVARDEVRERTDATPATARDIESFARLGAVDALFDVRDPLAPASGEVQAVRAALACVFADPARALRAPCERLTSAGARESRRLSREVRAALRAQW